MKQIIVHQRSFEKMNKLFPYKEFAFGARLIWWYNMSDEEIEKVKQAKITIIEVQEY